MRRIILSILFLGVVAMSFAQQRPKVAVVLCGGGAKGAAHVGALRVIEEAGVPVDIIVGTSMGAIVGGLYSVGYTPDQMDSLFKSQDWEYMLSDQVSRLDHSFTKKEYMDKYFLSLPLGKREKNFLGRGVVRGHNVLNLLTQLTLGYHDSIDFNKLPIPFACVAQDIYNGEEVVLHSGHLPLCIRSSMSIPGVFAPVSIGDHLLIDGGMCNNFPVDVARSMGADIVIGIDVQNQLKTKKEDLENVLSVLGQLIDLTGEEKYKKNVDDTDIYIKVNVEGYSTASFTKVAIDTLIQRGTQAAMAKQTELLALGAKMKHVDNTAFRQGIERPTKFFVKDITFKGLDEHDQKMLMKRGHIAENDSISIDQIKQAVTMMYSVLNYASVNYQLIENDEGFDLIFTTEEKKEGSVNVGIRFDSEEIAAMAMNITHRLGDLPLSASLSGRLGKRYGVRMDFTYSPFIFTQVNLGYEYMYNDVNLYDFAKRLGNVTYRHNTIDANITNLLFYFKLKFALGVKYENFNYNSFVYKNFDDLKYRSADYISYYAHVVYDSRNKKNFPSKGNVFTADYSFVTRNFRHIKDQPPFSAVKAEWETYIPVTDRFVIAPAVRARLVLGDSIPFPFYNAIGGFVSGRYAEQQLPFAGVGNLEVVDEAVLIPSIMFRQRLWKKHYISLIGNVLFCAPKTLDLFNEIPKYGVSLGYGFDTFFGPLEGIFYYSNRGDRFKFYVNLGLTF